MKNLITLCLFYFIAVSSTHSQWNRVQLSENITTETKKVQEFDKIYATDDFIVNVNFSDSETSLRIEANQNLHELIQVKVENGQLKLSTKSYSSSRKSASERLIAHVTVPNLVSIAGSGDAEYYLLDPLRAKKLNLNLNDDAILKGKIHIEQLTVNLDSDAELSLKGSANNMSVKADSDSVIDGYDFSVDNLDIKLNGDSEAELTVNETIDITARGDSEFTYKGKGIISSKRITGDSDVNHKR